jgi:uncharacterized damage-inducible protein DinB
MKISHAIIALALPVTLAAQQPAAGPPPGGPITTAFRGRITNLQRNLAQAFDSIPESKFSYKPTPAQLTIGYIAMHLANDNYSFCNAMGELKDKRTPEETSTPDSVKATWPKGKLVEQLKTSFAFCQQAFAQLDDAKLAEPTTASFSGRPNPMQTTRAAMTLAHAIDMADHYSQIANYMRLNGMLPPSALPRPPARP